MVNTRAKTNGEDLRQDVSGMINAADAMNSISIEELHRRSDSLIENIGALRFSVARIELLNGHRLALRGVIEECKILADEYGSKALIKRINQTLKDTDSA